VVLLPRELPWRRHSICENGCCELGIAEWMCTRCGQVRGEPRVGASTGSAGDVKQPNCARKQTKFRHRSLSPQQEARLVLLTMTSVRPTSALAGARGSNACRKPDVSIVKRRSCAPPRDRASREPQPLSPSIRGCAMQPRHKGYSCASRVAECCPFLALCGPQGAATRAKCAHGRKQRKRRILLD
jgi:hypothetical protein